MMTLTNALRALPTPEPTDGIRARVMAQVNGETAATTARRTEWRIERRPGVVWERRVGWEPPPAFLSEGGGSVQYTRRETTSGRAVYQTINTTTRGEQR